ncbi:DTW domain-containing protein [Microbulbifer yueqingensis]|uniref:tRNA-uridine aminocarboxypropyltransferase n=1 Tax=Microbulbifer yueqingensis TaxID=658219 RepID=A0A1G9DLQ1_9GAMM|nr:tRNA-uridine aminocarboxypropyltransferase [Microbulbifer yueqingensis]SDK64764.1 DTW domain-containing protein [Microbulbifer yueqingensis]
MKIYLLTHERELHRPTNTGSLVPAACGGLVRRVVWQRRHPDPEIVGLIEAGDAALVYPVTEADQSGGDLPIFENFIVLDATWQEARKMYNQSAYLKSACKVALIPALPSEYGLRRNQRPGGLCTAECVIEILQAKGFESVAEQLRNDFRRFNLAKPGKKM